MRRVLVSLCHCWLVELSLRRLLETFSGVSTSCAIQVVILLASHDASRPSCVCAQYRMGAGPMGHGSRLCFRSGLAGVARARCRVECGALQSFINGKPLKMSDFAGGGIMAGSRPVAILARGRSSEVMAAGATERTRHRELMTDQTRSIVQLAVAEPLSSWCSPTSFAILALTVTPAWP